MRWLISSGFVEHVQLAISVSVWFFIVSFTILKESSCSSRAAVEFVRFVGPFLGMVEKRGHSLQEMRMKRAARFSLCSSEICACFTIFQPCAMLSLASCVARSVWRRVQEHCSRAGVGENARLGRSAKFIMEPSAMVAKWVTRADDVARLGAGFHARPFTCWAELIFAPKYFLATETSWSNAILLYPGHTITRSASISP